MMEKVLRTYIKDFVRCKTCNSPETTLNKRDRLYFLFCNKCQSWVAPIWFLSKTIIFQRTLRSSDQARFPSGCWKALSTPYGRPGRRPKVITPLSLSALYIGSTCTFITFFIFIFRFTQVMRACNQVSPPFPASVTLPGHKSGWRHNSLNWLMTSFFLTHDQKCIDGQSNWPLYHTTIPVLWLVQYCQIYVIYDVIAA